MSESEVSQLRSVCELLYPHGLLLLLSTFQDIAKPLSLPSSSTFKQYSSFYSKEKKEENACSLLLSTVSNLGFHFSVRVWVLIEYTKVCRKGIRTYRDDPNLERGDEISPALSRAIEESKISVVVFSKEYASSSWCLNELVHILKCKNERGQIVLPVFYNIDPSDIRKQKGSYAIAFAAHEERFEPKKVMEWRNALTAAADLSGFHSQDEYESELIEKIVEDVWRKLNRLPQIAMDSKGLVGIDERLEEIESLLCKPNPRGIGLWGMGGIGKTTLARAIFNWYFYQFKSRCFLENVRENSQKYGLAHLEIKLFSTLLDLRNLETVDHFVRNRLIGKKVLIVLDDIDDIDQLEKLIGDGSWFGEGSKIIITTRDKQVILSADKEVYEGTEEIEGIYLDISKIDDALHLEPIVFNNMHRLRLLKIYVSDYSHQVMSKYTLLKVCNFFLVL
ncbi:TMV resistance protein N [Morus notabilis]|uniref:TMV resistance protein N n=1 Tax=Morus notabilis TaxID=981085 RepID=W9RCZ7_9ROSA|nr:TMV resistance protein N [Morus notabilis]